MKARVIIQGCGMRADLERRIQELFANAEMNPAQPVKEEQVKAALDAAFMDSPLIPKKPVVMWVKKNFADVSCPICGEHFFRTYIQHGAGSWVDTRRKNFCGDCGQAIDWSGSPTD